MPRRALRFVTRALARLRAPRAAQGLACVCVCAALLGAWSLPRGTDEAPPRAAAVAVGEADVDAALRRAALSAIGSREGAVVVMDARDGRVRAVVNPRLAFEEAFPPGSTVKPFTMLTALRAGALDADTRVLCRQRYNRDGFETHCSHPHLKPPFTPARALAYSCNYYFSRLGEGLDAGDFNATLGDFGFGVRTGAGGDAEAPGAVPRGPWRTAYALGDAGDQLLVTPAQLVAAYAALANGGHLYAPRPAPPQNFAARERARVRVAEAHRALLLDGMRGAVTHGTAAPADLASLAPYVFGKTGTSTPLDDFRTTHGWFVGLASEQPAAGGRPAPEGVRLAVLVFLKRGRGSECAEVARPVFEEYARLEAERRKADAAAGEPAGEDVDGAGADALDGGAAPGLAGGVRVRLTQQRATLRVRLEDYVFGVLAAEASTEGEFEALKAQAVVSRTFAVRNAARHARAGFDFCDSTHCQRYLRLRDESARPDFYELLRRAVAETSGEVLRDRAGRVADSYFSAACGGRTADIRTLWGVARAPAHLRGVQDEACASAPPVTWTDAIPAARLARALGDDARTDVGARLDRVRVARRDASGRAELLELAGERRRLVRGWDFKIVVGRALGWNKLKSTRFEVARVGESFVFRGLGFGHGLGLCQAGAHVLARRGASYRHILEHYMPGTSVGTAEFKQTDETAAQRDYGSRLAALGTIRMADGGRRTADGGVMRPAIFSSISHPPPATRVLRAAFLNPPSAVRRPPSKSPHSAIRLPHPARLTLASEHFRVSYPARPAASARRDAEAALRALEEAHADVSRRLAAASLGAGGLAVVELFVHETTGDFVGATGQPAWVAAVTRGRRVESQPLDTLRRRGVLTTTLRHEYVHAVVEALGRGRTPRWLTEGLAAYVSGEGAALSRVGLKGQPSLGELERGLERPASAQEMRALYAAAYREVNALIRSEGEAAVWRRVAGG